MAKTYKKSKDEMKLEVNETITDTRQTQYTIEELENVIADLEAKKTEFQEMLTQAQTLKVGVIEAQPQA